MRRFSSFSFIIFFNFVITSSLYSHGFGPSTFVKTSAYFCDIKQLCLHEKKKEQEVLSFNINSKTICSRAITSAAHSETNCYIKLFFDEGMHDDIVCTPTQEFYLPELNQWRAAYRLKKEDKLLSHGWKLIPITLVQLVKAPLNVYSLEIEGTHTFFVGQHAVLTHNMIVPAMLIPMASIPLSAGAGAIIGFVAGSAAAVGGLVVIGLITKSILDNRVAHYRLSYDIAKVEQLFTKNTQENIQQCGAAFERSVTGQGTCGTSQQHQEVPVPGPCLQNPLIDDTQKGICPPHQENDQVPIPGPCMQNPADPEIMACEVIEPTAESMLEKGSAADHEHALQSRLRELNAQNKAQEPTTKSTNLQWTNHDNKHVPRKNAAWKDIVKETKFGHAKYKPDVNIEELEKYVWEHGIPVTHGKNWKVFKFDKIIGAISGKETEYVVIKYSANTIHGHPITYEEFKKYTKGI